MKKKWLVVSLVTGVAAMALTTGAVLAQAAPVSPTPGATATATPLNAFADKLAGILGIDPAKVEAAVQQVRQQDQQAAIAKAQAALKTRLDAEVKAGKITQAQEDSYLSWLASKPAGLPGPLGGLGAPGLRAPMGGRGFGGPGMMGRGHAPKAPGSPTTPAPTATPSVTGTSA